MKDCDWMQRALLLAKKAKENGEVPVGAVLVLEDKMIGQGANCPISHTDPSAHAEIMALRKGAEVIGNYRLLNTTLYVTLEPCIMCVGALVQARIKRLVYGAHDMKSGAVSSRIAGFSQPFLNHQVIWEGGVLAEECGQILSDFFKEKRKKTIE